MTPFFSIPGALSSVECDGLVAEVAQSQMKDAVLVRQSAAQDIRRADVAWLDDIQAMGWVMDRMIRLVSDANRAAFGFDLTDFGESAQVARYGAERQGHFDWHSDIGAGQWAARRKLTVVVQLSDPDAYEGGKLEIWPSNAVIAAAATRGTATVFPSFVLHRVTPVTFGTRWSLTLWAHGPAFR